MRPDRGQEFPFLRFPNFFPAQLPRQPSHLEYPLCTAPNRQVPDNLPINGYNRRPLSELASPYLLISRIASFSRKSQVRIYTCFHADPSSRICHDWLRSSLPNQRHLGKLIRNKASDFK